LKNCFFSNNFTICWGHNNTSIGSGKAEIVYPITFTTFAKGIGIPLDWSDNNSYPPNNWAAVMCTSLSSGYVGSRVWGNSNSTRVGYIIIGF